MKCKKVKKFAKDIKVENVNNEDVSVTNYSSLELIGKGRQGAVFKINDKLCMKVYGNKEDCNREHYALSLGSDTTLLPKLYCKGENFIVMEMIYGVDLQEYLQSQILTKTLSHELIKLLITYKEIGYERIDHHKRHIYLQDDGSLKVIDVGRAVWRSQTDPYPRRLLRSLGQYKSTFLDHVKEVNLELYKEWKYYLQMEEASIELYHALENNKKFDLEQFSKKTSNLLTTTSKKAHYKNLQKLVRKAIKEQRKREQKIDKG